MKPASENFGFLANHYPRIEGVAANAEHDWSRDPVGSLMRVRLFAELIARQCATKLRVFLPVSVNFADVVDALGARGIHADALDRSTLTRAFRGELVPQDPADEPASVLLDRIRAERAAAPAKARRTSRKATP